MEKRCNKCQEVKPVSEFQKESRALNGYKPRCKICTNEYYRSQYQKIKVNKSRQQKEYYLLNKEDKLIYSKNYYKLNKEKRKAKGKEWNKKNKKLIAEKALAYIKKRRKEDPVFKTMLSIRKCLTKLKINKTGSTMKMLGYSLDQLIISLGNTPNDTEAIDHRVPMSWFISKTPANIIHHLDNLHIISRSDNSIKGDRWAHPITNKYFKLIKSFLKKEKIKSIKLIT